MTCQDWYPDEEDDVLVAHMEDIRRLQERDNEMAEMRSHIADTKHVQALENANQKLREFFLEGFRLAAEGLDWDGSDIQRKAVELGLATEEAFDPEKHASLCCCKCEPGDTVFLINEEVFTIESDPICGH
jgi:hypothetical protein